MTNKLQENIKAIKSAIVAIGFNPSPQQITIIGSGFIAEGGKVITAAHLLNQLNDDQIVKLQANVMTKQLNGDIEGYEWIPIKLIPGKKTEKDDIAIFELRNKKNIGELELGDSDGVEIGQDIYFIGFPYAAQLINEGFGITLVVNKGIISNVKRDGTDAMRKRNWFIVDAISNPGNSGCPLIDVETNKVIGIMAIAFRTKSQVQPNLDIREPMHIAGAKPINLVRDLLNH